MRSGARAKPCDEARRRNGTYLAAGIKTVTVRSGQEGRAKIQGIRGTSEGTIKTRAGPRDPSS